MAPMITPVKDAGTLPAVNTLLTNPISIPKTVSIQMRLLNFLLALVKADNFAPRWMPNDASIVAAIGIWMTRC